MEQNWRSLEANPVNVTMPVRSIISSHIAQFLKNISTRAADVEVFTQPGSLADIATHSRNVRFCHESGYTPKDFELNRIMSDVVRIVERANSASNM